MVSCILLYYNIKGKYVRFYKSESCALANSLIIIISIIIIRPLKNRSHKFCVNYRLEYKPSVRFRMDKFIRGTHKIDRLYFIFDFATHNIAGQIFHFLSVLIRINVDKVLSVLS